MATFANIAAILGTDAQMLLVPSSLVGTPTLTAWTDTSGASHSLSSMTGSPQHGTVSGRDAGSFAHLSKYGSGPTWTQLTAASPTQYTAIIACVQNANGGANAKGGGNVWQNPGYLGDSGQFANLFSASTRAAQDYMQTAPWTASEKSLEVTVPAQGTTLIASTRLNGANLTLRCNGQTDSRSDFGTFNAGKANVYVGRSGAAAGSMANLVSFVAVCNVDIGASREAAVLAQLSALYGVAA